MRSASRLVILALSVLFLALPMAVSAAAAEAPAVEHAVAGQPVSPSPSQPGATAPPGPTLEPADTEAQQAESRRKLVMGIASVILIGIVIWGRSIRRKKKVKAK